MVKEGYLLFIEKIRSCIDGSPSLDKLEFLCLVLDLVKLELKIDLMAFRQFKIWDEVVEVQQEEVREADEAKG
jgi:hypothetical protein